MLDTILSVIKSPNILGIVIRIGIIAIITYIAVQVVIKTNQKIASKSLLLQKFLKNVIVTVIYLMGLLTAIDQIPQLGQVTKTILAGSGILALAISLSAQESLNNIISGLFIILFKPFEVGDRITLVNSKITGTIEDITLRHTVIKTFTNSRVVIPNSTMNKEVIENSNLTDSRASSFIDVYVAYESDIRKAMQLMAEIVGTHPLCIDTRKEDEIETKPLVPVYLRELGDSGICLRASVWTRTVGENFDACSDIRLKIVETFKEQGIEIPYNKMDINIRKEN